jgi:hypothetical protein
MKGTLVASFGEKESAELLKNRLLAAGLSADVNHESNLQRFAFWVTPEATEKVTVNTDQFEAATALIDQWEKSDHVLEDAIRCPQCHSPRVEYPQFTRKFLTPWLVEIFASLGAYPLEYYCQQCQYTWPKQIKLDPERDLLGFPKK